jgi:hypothetical protein
VDGTEKKMGKEWDIVGERDTVEQEEPLTRTQK